MKKIICIFILALFFFSCNNDGNNKDDDDKTNNNTKKELDQRLVGGLWYNVYNYMPLNKDEEHGFYEFSTKQLYTYLSSLCEIHESSNFQRDVYSKDGIIYDIYDNKLLKYEFTEIWPFPDTKTYELQPELRGQLDQIAAAGNIIKYSLYNKDGTLFDDGRYAQDWVLMRFSE
jgi:asparagine N-glycosylation enzyme membrane subunit Stt3